MLQYRDSRPVLDNLNDDARQHLNNFMYGTVVGQSENYTTPFLPSGARGHELEYAEEIYTQYALTPYFDQLNEIEQREAKKFGPFSVRDPWELRRSLFEAYFSQKEELPSTEGLEYAVNQVVRLNQFRLSCLPLDLAYANLPPGTNLGLPEFTSDKRAKGEYLKRARHLAASGYEQGFLYPCVVGWRGQPNGSTVHIKNRTVWMFDHLETIVGLSAQIPTLNALRGCEEFAAWNNLDHVDEAMTKVLHTSHGDKIISVDFSGFDQSVPGWLISLAFKILKSWFATRDWPQLDWLEHQFKTTGCLTPDGWAVGRVGGVPSGSALTNLIDSLCQLILWHYVSWRLRVEIRFLTVLGDDGVILFKGSPAMDEISDLVQAEFGMTVSSDKGGTSSDSAQFLQRLHMLNYKPDGSLCRGVRSVMRTWNGVCHLERRTSDLPPQFFSARAIMQLENCKWHPNFTKLVGHYFRVDRYAKVLDPVEIFDEAGGTGKVEEVLRLRSFKSGQELPSQGLNQFATVSELRRLRAA
jgi:hypothetical protein